ncbi:Uncharacterized protein C7orf57-like protein [Trichoplax sp. H2]|uniref:Uncharacterized protein n=1 Tax=Trichoplax adhaerens TaxID=10228 RepID=B3RRG1_TRIAD|nr:hypothetical protein TRIADDRAFT_54225 [Trichoplax adhaerens]EDV26340.1 hypothetical protein TRIADDRAFT_54225 [Trichoplax adhaerens]RDD37647.1 Uncharacterized protein C7orf57-like protein [Trichoplax sp. H2]|eukprot:XP_002110336.1 hypothetical protein TRIADDRAFT_54225 [Trichoplax adhaerens]
MPSFFKDFQGQDWFYHAPNKKLDSEEKNAQMPVLSQVPGLSDVAGEDSDPFAKSKKGWIRDTDSRYIQMAKQGGRKDLLMFNVPHTISKDPIAYPRVDWFDHQQPDIEIRQPRRHEPDRDIYGEYLTLNKKTAPAGVITNQGSKGKDLFDKPPPFSLDDDLSYWQRKKTEKSEKQEKPKQIDRFKLPPLKSNKESLVNGDAANNVQKTKGKKNGENVNFNYLMSMGYQKDWFDEKERKDKEDDDKKRKQQTLLKEKVRQGMKPRNPQTYTDKVENKDQFKLSKFKNVNSKINTRWSERQ